MEQQPKKFHRRALCRACVCSSFPDRDLRLRSWVEEGNLCEVSYHDTRNLRTTHCNCGATAKTEERSFAHLIVCSAKFTHCQPSDKFRSYRMDDRSRWRLDDRMNSGCGCWNLRFEIDCQLKGGERRRPQGSMVRLLWPGNDASWSRFPTRRFFFH